MLVRATAMAPQFWVSLLVVCSFSFTAEASRLIADGGLRRALQDLSGSFHALEGLAGLPVESQKAMLRIMGAAMQKEWGEACNIFGGASDCQKVPGDSGLSMTCRSYNPTVDCAFDSPAFLQMFEDPDDHLEKAMKDAGLRPCHSCLDALHALWCGQTVPTCGTFDKMLTEILPIIQAIVVNGKSPHEAFAAALPAVLKAGSLGLPCREMCDAVSASCGCGQNETVGTLMEELIDEEAKRAQAPASPHGERFRSPFDTHMSEETLRALFAKVWEEPICHMFAPQSLPGFDGVCELPKSSGDECEWCAPGSAIQLRKVWHQVAAQLSQMVAGMMRAGLQDVLDPPSRHREGEEATHPWSWEGMDREPEQQHHGSWDRHHNNMHHHHPNHVTSKPGVEASAYESSSASSSSSSSTASESTRAGGSPSAQNGLIRQVHEREVSGWWVGLMMVLGLVVTLGGVGGGYLLYMRRKEREMAAMYMSLTESSDYKPPQL